MYPSFKKKSVHIYFNKLKFDCILCDGYTV